MIVVRFLIAIMVSLSVALVPAVGAAAVPVPAAVQASMADRGGMPCDKAPGGCESPAICALKCFNFPGALHFELVFVPRGSTVVPIRTGSTITPHESSAPTRPPPA